MKFLIQTDSQSQILHDFSHTLLKAIEYCKWFQREEIAFILSEGKEGKVFKEIECIPIGSVEFVTDFIDVKYGIRPKPRNVPEELFPYANRQIYNGNQGEVLKGRFVKSNDKIKDSRYSGIYDNSMLLVDGNYQVSEVVDFQSEYRGFIFKGELVGLKHYLGDFKIFPNIETILNMINAFKSSPIAYTLDVGILSSGQSAVIEVHDFFSCGLYGFNRLDILPYMFSSWFYQFIKGSVVL